jgi:uncharacterized protein (TIGR01777 family)
MKKVVISGGSGLIGSALASKLVNDGCEVVILTRSDNLRKPVMGIRYVQWDANTSGKWESELEGADSVVNLAGESIGGGLWTNKRKNRILNSRLAGGNALVSGLNKCLKKPKLFIQASAIGIYGISESLKMDENSPLGNDFLSGIARQWEGSTKDLELSTVRRAIIRTGIVLDLKEGAFPLVLLPYQIFFGGRLGSGWEWFSWIHLKDEVDAIAYIIENKLEGVFNLTAPNPVTNNELGKIISKVTKRPNWFPIPGIFLRMLLGEMSTLVLDGQQVLPGRLINAGYKFTFEQIEPALRDLLRRNKGE